jgi:SNF2 family DNA or RNA helicase
MAQLLELSAQSHGRYIRLSDGEFLALSEKLRQQLNRLAAIASRHHSRLQMSPFSAALLSNDMLEGELQLEGDEELQKIRQRIKNASRYRPHIPETLQATLRTYQKEGYQWMMRLNKWGAGALLADDMGLGKTIQTIALLLAKAKEGPALVIAPASVTPNWNTEFARFAPSLNVIMLNYEINRTEAIKQA